MKKAKLMLAVIAVLAVVGGALAFRSSALNITKYCVEDRDNQSNGCTILGTYTFAPAEDLISYTITSEDFCPTTNGPCEQSPTSLIDEAP